MLVRLATYRVSFLFDKLVMQGFQRTSTVQFGSKHFGIIPKVEKPRRMERSIERERVNVLRHDTAVEYVKYRGLSGERNGLGAGEPRMKREQAVVGLDGIACLGIDMNTGTSV